MRPCRLTAWYVLGPLIGLIVIALMATINQRGDGLLNVLERATAAPRLNWRWWFLFGVLAASSGGCSPESTVGDGYGGSAAPSTTARWSLPRSSGRILILRRQDGRGRTAGNGIGGCSRGSVASFSATQPSWGPRSRPPPAHGGLLMEGMVSERQRIAPAAPRDRDRGGLLGAAFGFLPPASSPVLTGSATCCCSRPHLYEMMFSDGDRLPRDPVARRFHARALIGGLVAWVTERSAKHHRRRRDLRARLGGHRFPSRRSLANAQGVCGACSRSLGCSSIIYFRRQERLAGDSEPSGPGSRPSRPPPPSSKHSFLGRRCRERQTSLRLTNSLVL
jgi:hypothetical protein